MIQDDDESPGSVLGSKSKTLVPELARIVSSIVDIYICNPANFIDLKRFNKIDRRKIVLLEWLENVPEQLQKASNDFSIIA